MELRMRERVFSRHVGHRAPCSPYPLAARVTSSTNPF
jgi:hypothetical protein